MQFTKQVESQAFNLADADNLESAKLLEAVMQGQVSRKDLAKIRLLIDGVKLWNIYKSCGRI